MAEEIPWNLAAFRLLMKLRSPGVKYGNAIITVTAQGPLMDQKGRDSGDGILNFVLYNEDVWILKNVYLNVFEMS